MEIFMKQNNPTYKLALAGLFTALAVAGSMISFQIVGSKCAPVQHAVNIFASVLLGPGWSVGIAFSASLLRNLTGLGSLMAFPGSMAGALLCGLIYRLTHSLLLTCAAETFGTSVLGGLLAYPVAKLLMNANPTGAFAYMTPFFISTAIGSVLAFSLLKLLQKSGVLVKIQFQAARQNSL